MPENDKPTETTSDAGASKVGQLTAAFARMMGQPAGTKTTETSEQSPTPREEVATPRGILEAILFVGLPGSGPDGEALPVETLAGAMRGVTPAEVLEEIGLLNTQYEEDGAPYRIDASPAGYRMVLRDEFHSLRDRYHGRVRAARLTPAALEALAIIAYNQPISAKRIDELRDEKSGSALTQLVRRGLVVRETQLDSLHADDPVGPWFRTTERLLKLLDLEQIHQLPRLAEHEG